MRKIPVTSFSGTANSQTFMGLTLPSYNGLTGSLYPLVTDLTRRQRSMLEKIEEQIEKQRARRTSRERERFLWEKQSCNHGIILGDKNKHNSLYKGGL